MRRLQKAFTLIELMIVVAIIGILAAVAIPAYQDYITRSQMSEAIVLLSSTKAPLGEYLVDKAEVPAAVTEVASNTSGKYTASIDLASGATTTNVTLVATMRTSGVNSAIAGKTVNMLTEDGGKTWICRSSDLPSKFLPAACR